MAEITREQWEAKGSELFGNDKEKWRFACPICGNEMSIERARAEFPELKGRGWRPEQECIGRGIDTPAARMKSGDRCDWCAYGLFRGPLLVTVGEGKQVAVFDFAGKPFTGKGAPRG